jgi:hypothetical protein
MSRTNRDHAKKKQRPMIENAVIAEQLKTLLIPVMKGLAHDPVQYFAAPENQDLGIVKRRRKLKIKLIVASFPEQQKGSDSFFFQTPLTTGLAS